MARRLVVEVSCKPRTCGNCRLWRRHYRLREQQEIAAPFCELFGEWLIHEHGRRYRCNACLDAEKASSQ